MDVRQQSVFSQMWCAAEKKNYAISYVLIVDEKQVNQQIWQKHVSWKSFFFFFLPVNDINSRRQGLFWLVLFKRGHSSWFMLWTNPSVNSVPQNPNSQRSVAPGQQRVIYLMVNESLILCKRQVRVARAPADREIFAAWAFSQKVWAVPQSRRQGQGNNVWSVMALL